MDVERRVEREGRLKSQIENAGEWGMGREAVEGGEWIEITDSKRRGGEDRWSGAEEGAVIKITD